MKKNKLYYLLFIILLMFSFTSGVKGEDKYVSMGFNKSTYGDNFGTIANLLCQDGVASCDFCTEKCKNSSDKEKIVCADVKNSDSALNCADSSEYMLVWYKEGKEAILKGKLLDICDGNEPKNSSLEKICKADEKAITGYTCKVPALSGDTNNQKLIDAVYSIKKLDSNQSITIVCEDGDEFPNVSINNPWEGVCGNSPIKYVTLQTLTEADCKDAYGNIDTEVTANTAETAEEYKNRKIYEWKDWFGPEYGALSCEELLGDELIGYIQQIVNIIKIVVPILLIVFGTIDFGKAIFVNDDGEMKKSQTKFIKRLIIAVAFFLVPTLLTLILNIAHNIWPSIEASLCGITF